MVTSPASPLYLSEALLQARYFTVLESGGKTSLTHYFITLTSVELMHVLPISVVQLDDLRTLESYAR